MITIPAPSPMLPAAPAFEAFKARLEREFFAHPVIVDNAYTRWFARGMASEAQIRDLILQFSVFSNHFLVVQAKRMVWARSEESERLARFILMNECGVALDRETGSAEGKTFTTRNAHINWLRELGAELGLNPRDLGRWDLGTKATHAFLRGLDRTYGSPDPSLGSGASFAIETWAAFGIGDPEIEHRNFWHELIAGLEAFNAREGRDLPLGFFKYHFQLESGHGANVWKELESSFQDPEFDPEKFLEGGRKALESIWTFWKGLDRTRKTL
jgi:hypothetical protein